MHSAQLSVTASVNREHYFYMPSQKQSFSQPAALPPCSAHLESICVAFHSWNKNEIWAGFIQCHDAYFTLEQRKLGYANQTHHNLTSPLLHHTLYVRHHHVLMAIIVQLFKLSTPPLFSAHLFACICAHPASLTFFLLPNILVSPNSYTSLPLPLLLWLSHSLLHKLVVSTFQKSSTYGVNQQCPLKDARIWGKC